MNPVFKDSKTELKDDSILSLVTTLSQNLETNDWTSSINICKTLADNLREPSFRSPLGESGLIETLSKLLKMASGKQTDFQIQALRVLGNLCFDHMDNRKRVKDAGIFPIIAPYFDNRDLPDLIRTACGFCLNSSMDYAPIQIEIAETGIAEKLIALIEPEKVDDGSITLALKTLDNLVAEDKARKTISTPSTVKTYMNMIEYYFKSGEYMDELDNMENLVDTLLQLIMDDDDLQNEIIDMNGLPTLLDFLEYSKVEKDDKERLEDIQKTASKIAIYASSTDSKMNELYDTQLERFLNMAKNNESEVVHQCAVYILGNLARSDEHCIELVEKHHLSQLLLNLYQTTENATFQYAILGCLKHLCLPTVNKEMIGNSDCIAIITPVLDKDMLKRNQFLTIGILKLLVMGNYKNAKQVIQENNTLSHVISFIKRVDDVAAKSEATRILTNLVKTVWIEKDNADLKMKLMEFNIMEPIIELVRISTFSILKNDGIMALTLIFSDLTLESELDKALPLFVIHHHEEDEVDQKEKVEQRSFFEVLIDDICSENNEIPIQIKCNACVLLCKIVEAAKRRSVSQDFSDIITTIRALSLDRIEKLNSDPELYKYTSTLMKSLQQ
ncbi:armadillo-type protein [Cokeromyces recurvatus]|uniref:armadillo-type protein n=1 Tax=Cokeromyces recurvatus TaxID=90255 RepID=UPI00221F5869|nr:armadillo-type protein [Cokeromyces recurvatus]KAI7902649.1 armadillo-type protein [Cokeromyces recurvatus]